MGTLGSLAHLCTLSHQVYVSSQEEILKVLELGQTLRATSSTNINEQSSRSHALFMLTVSQKDTATLHIRRGKLVLVRAPFRAGRSIGADLCVRDDGAPSMKRLETGLTATCVH